MEIQIDETTSKKLNKILQDLAHFTALYEQSDDRFAAREKEINTELDNFKNTIHQQLANIQTAITDLNEVMTVAGAARWRLAAEQAMNQGAEHLTAIKEATEVFKRLADDSAAYLDHAAMSAEKRIASAMQNLSKDNFALVEEFQRRAEQTYQRLDTQTTSSISTIQTLLRWIRWDRILIALGAAFIASFLMSIYINSEWPWESYAHSEQQRVIGKTILTAWPSLHEQQKAEINRILGTHIGEKDKTR